MELLFEYVLSNVDDSEQAIQEKSLWQVKKELTDLEQGKDPYKKNTENKERNTIK